MVVALIAVLPVSGSWLLAQVTVSGNPTTHPTAAPAVNPLQQQQQRSAEEMLRQMLQPSTQAAQPLKPLPDEPVPADVTGGPNAVAPAATTQPLMIEGSLVLDRIGRLTRCAVPGTWEFTFDSDGRQMTDAPLILLPNKSLSKLEDLWNNSYRDMRLRVSGEVTEYRGRNYLLLQRWVQVPDVALPLR